MLRIIFLYRRCLVFLIDILLKMLGMLCRPNPANHLPGQSTAKLISQQCLASIYNKMQQNLTKLPPQTGTPRILEWNEKSWNSNSVMESHGKLLQAISVMENHRNVMEFNRL